MLDKIKDAVTPICRQVNYGPFKGVGPGAAAWHCNRCFNGSSVCVSVEDAQQRAEDHATTHPGMRAVYYEG
jgi:hypothetical protein